MIWKIKKSPYLCSPFEKNGQFIDKFEKDNEVKKNKKQIDQFFYLNEFFR